MGMAGVPLPCDLRRFIAWMTVSENHMNNSHAATDDYYRNVTQCVIKEPNDEINRTINNSADPAHFNGNIQFYIKKLMSQKRQTKIFLTRLRKIPTRSTGLLLILQLIKLFSYGTAQPF